MDKLRNIVLTKRSHDFVDHGQYTMERLPDNVLTAEQASSYLQATMDLIHRFPNSKCLS